MMKAEFLKRLDTALAQLSEADRRRYVESYAELIEDKVEDGMAEADAVASLGDIDQIAREILGSTPLPVLMCTAVKPRRGWSVGSIILIVLGMPVWLPILAALGAVILSVYLVIWSVVAALYASVAAVLVAAVGCIIAGFLTGSLGGILLCLGAALILAGLGLLFGAAVVALTKLLAKLTAWIFRKIKGLFIRKG